ncbi:unnamed protein product [Didymodactylos carnosus]|uniref:TM2 domain-containing protein n=1 Tax=Didymodactylos carnosus TaxID=1234261 RepID=A0A814A5V1_9BILA|nr:unnamed protein product [Didymodactylos carnosus]CAF3690655.1 unnamed protein product [Didymodactylos carnosus]
MLTMLRFLFGNGEYEKCLHIGLIYCQDVPVECLDCLLEVDCVYGQIISTKCIMLNGTCLVSSTSSMKVREFEKNYTCRYCYQVPLDNHTCTPYLQCKKNDYYQSNCTIDSNILCLGSRTFYRNVECSFTSGYRTRTVFILSVLLGGFGVDRFYLGQVKEGFGKIFSFGGLGVWTLIDSILIACGYLTPEDGSVYITT